MMQYKGYSGKVEFDDEAEIFHGEESEKPLSARLGDFCEQNRIDMLYVFGSRTGDISRYVLEGSGLASENASDVDIAVRVALDRKLSLRDKVEMTTALEDLLGVDRVDLAFLHEADPFLAANII